MMDTKQIVLNHVTRKGACGFGVNEASSAKSIQDLINLLLTPKGIEHCMEYRFPSFDVLLANKEDLLSNNVFVEGKYSISNPRLVIAFGGDISIHCDGYSAVEVYATNDAKIHVSAKDHSCVFVELHHNSSLEFSQSDNAIVKEFRK